MSPEIAIVTITGFNTRELELHVRQQGIHYYMTKPANMKALKHILDHISKKVEQLSEGEMTKEQTTDQAAGLAEEAR